MTTRKSSSLVPVPRAQAAPLLRFLVNEADGLSALERKQLELDKELARLADVAAATVEAQRLEDAKERYAAVRKKALDVPEVIEAKAKVTQAKASFSAVPAVVEAKKVARELTELDEATRNRRRQMVAAIFARRAPTVPEQPPIEGAFLKPTDPLPGKPPELAAAAAQTNEILARELARANEAAAAPVEPPRRRRAPKLAGPIAPAAPAFGAGLEVPQAERDRAAGRD